MDLEFYTVFEMSVYLSFLVISIVNKAGILKQWYIVWIDFYVKQGQAVCHTTSLCFYIESPAGGNPSINYIQYMSSVTSLSLVHLIKSSFASRCQTDKNLTNKFKGIDYGHP